MRIAIRLRKRPAKGARRRRPRVRWRTRLHLAVVLVALVAVGLLFLQVSLTRRFEGRLWMLPARIYSDALILLPGQAVAADELVQRLERSGYARTGGNPVRPGQYSRNGSVLEVHRRGFEAAGVRAESRRLRLGFRDGRLGSITDRRGRVVDHAAFEPELLATLFGPRQEERFPVPLDEVPDRLRSAVLAAEDGRFYRHHGVDLRGILRAGWTNMRRGRIVQGGSTITQQTVKNIFLDHRRTWWRKAREGLMSVLLDASYSKDRILEVYLNEVYLGQRGAVAICGMQSASRFYLGRDVAELTLGESALLAGLISSPGRFNPFAHPERAVERRDQVLGTMERLGMITTLEAADARTERLELASGGGGFSTAAYAVDFVRSRLGALVSSEALPREGLRIYTTIDTLWQRHSEDALQSGLERLERGRKGARNGEPLQGAVVVLEARSGAVRALVGGREYAKSQFNRATQARRQPGSAFKPFVYAAGFERVAQDPEQGLTPATLLDDSPLEMVSGGKTWRPANYDGEYRGWVTVRTALEQSLNVPTVRAARRVGLERVVETAHRVGIESPLAPLPSLALGAFEVTPLELAAGYSTLARLGRAARPWVIREIVDDEGRVLVRPEVEWSRALSPQAAYLVNHLLRGVLRDGTARSAARLGYRGSASGKTGTTDDMRDAWFVGYSSQWVSLVWVGYDDNSKSGLTGASGALPIWTDLLLRQGEDAYRPPDPVPAGIVERRIDPETGGLLRRGCDRWIDERFAVGSEPRHDCTVHGGRFRRWFRNRSGQG